MQPKNVKNIWQAKSTLKLGTHGGPLVSNQVCDIPDLGKAWLNKDSIANIISLAHKVTYDSERERAFLVHMPHKIVQFSQMSNGLYAMNPLIDDNCTTTNKFQFVKKFEEYLCFLTPRQQE